MTATARPTVKESLARLKADTPKYPKWANWKELPDADAKAEFGSAAASYRVFRLSNVRAVQSAGIADPVKVAAFCLVQGELTCVFLRR